SLNLPGQVPVHLLQRVRVFLLDPPDRLVAPEQHHPAVLAFSLVDVGIRLPHRPLIVSVNHPVGRHASTPLCRIATVHPTSGLSRKLCKPGSEPPVATGPVAGQSPRGSAPAEDGAGGVVTAARRWPVPPAGRGDARHAAGRARRASPEWVRAPR